MTKKEFKKIAKIKLTEIVDKTLKEDEAAGYEPFVDVDMLDSLFKEKEPELYNEFTTLYNDEEKQYDFLCDVIDDILEDEE